VSRAVDRSRRSLSGGGSRRVFLDFGRNHVQPESLADDAASRDGPCFVFLKFEFEQPVFGVLGGEIHERIANRFHFGRASVARIGPQAALSDSEFEYGLLPTRVNLVSSQDFLVFFGHKLIGGLSGITRSPGARDEKERGRGDGDYQRKPVFVINHSLFLLPIFDLNKKYE
jgi:hypothetical protein